MRECRKIGDLLGAYVYGDVTPDETRRVDEHIKECKTCRHDLETRAGAVALVPDDLPALTDDEKLRIMWSVKGALRAEREGNVIRSPYMSFVRGFALTALVAAAFGAGTLLVRNKPPKVIVKHVPVKEHHSAPAPALANAPNRDNVADSSGPSINQPIIIPERRIAVQPPGRDNVPETYRWSPKRRPRTDLPKLSPVPAQDNLSPLLEMPKDDVNANPVPPLLMTPGEEYSEPVESASEAEPVPPVEENGQ